MTITYTNRKGIIYYLCQGVTKTGKPRYFFAREPKGEAVEEIPAGWKINESVNGQVSLVRDRPVQISAEEIVAVQSELQRHPRASDYRVDIKQDQILLYARVGIDAEELITHMGKAGFPVLDQADSLRELMDRRAQFTPVLRFRLIDVERRIFVVQQVRQQGGASGWVAVGERGQIPELARKVIRQLGTRRFSGPY